MKAAGYVTGIFGKELNEVDQGTYRSGDGHFEFLLPEMIKSVGTMYNGCASASPFGVHRAV